MNKESIVKEIENLKMYALNLEIQSSQIEDDASARGAMVATECIKKGLDKLEGLFNEW